MATEQNNRVRTSEIILDEVSSEPLDPTQDTQVKLILKTDCVCFQFNDGGTVRYKYLDMNGTGVTWVHSTTPP